MFLLHSRVKLFETHLVVTLDWAMLDCTSEETKPRLLLLRSFLFCLAFKAVSREASPCTTGSDSTLGEPWPSLKGMWFHGWKEYYSRTAWHYTEGRLGQLYGMRLLAFSPSSLLSVVSAAFGWPLDGLFGPCALYLRWELSGHDIRVRDTCCLFYQSNSMWFWRD